MDAEKNLTQEYIETLEVICCIYEWLLVQVRLKLKLFFFFCYKIGI